MNLGLATRRDPAPVQEAATIALVDAALSRAAHRERFTQDEVMRLLQEIRVHVHDTPSGTAVDSVVNDALVSYADDPLLDRRRVADTLLDIRLALTGPNSEDLAPLADRT